MSEHELVSYVERIERVREQVKSLNSDVSDIYTEAKSNGYDVPAIKRVVKHRARDPEKAKEQDAIFETYLCAVEKAELEAGTRIATRARATRTRETKKGPSGDAGHASRSAPVAADGDHEDGESAVTTDSDALAINQPPAPSQDSERAAEVAPSVASAAPIRESDEFDDIRGSFLDRSLRVGQ